MQSIQDDPSGPFPWIIAHARFVVALSLGLVGVSLAFVPTLRKDTSMEAFVPSDLPVVATRDLVKELFGLSDPIVVAVENRGPQGVFTPDTLALVEWLTDRVADVQGVDPQRITSLATEKDIVGTADALLVEPFFDRAPRTQEEADAVRERAMALQLIQGKLLARDGSATLVVVEPLDQTHSQAVYEALLELVRDAPIRDERIWIAGEGAVNGYVGSYIDADAQRLNPLAIALIVATIAVSYRRLRAVAICLLIVVGAAGSGVGMMAAFGVPYFVITGALTVILIGVGVCDGIHILGHYYEKLARDPDRDHRQLVNEVMREMWRPVTVTSLTSVAGFLALSISSFMPPMRWFGVFASLGIAVAWLLSMTTVPAALVLTRPRLSPAFPAGGDRGDTFSRLIEAVGRSVLAHPTGVVAGLLVLGLFGAMGAFRLEVNLERIEDFQHDEPLYLADRAVNAAFDGTSILDVYVETAEPEMLYRPEVLARLDEFALRLQALPHVKGTSSIVEYVKQMNLAMNPGRDSAYTIPPDEDLVAQYFFLYMAMSDPTDFEDLVDNEFRRANLRVRMGRGRYTDFIRVVEEGRAQVERLFGDTGIRVEFGGWPAVCYHLMNELRKQQPIGVALALSMVTLVTSLSFRSLVAGLLAVLPVGFSVLVVYGVMGWSGIWLDVGTSMTTAIAIGIAVDFPVHVIDRLIELVRDQGTQIDAALGDLFPSTGRALFFNFAAIFLGFGLLCLSQVPSLARFGILVVVCVATSSLISLTVLPVAIRALQPAFLRPSVDVQHGTGGGRSESRRP